MCIRDSASSVVVSPEDNNILYVGSHIDHSLQKLQLTDTSCTVIGNVGTGFRSNLANTGDPGSIEGDDIRFSRVWGVSVTNTRILTSTARGYVDVFDEDKFNVSQKDTAWLDQMGGPRIRRWDGVKQAINAIVNDTTLTTGAHFGFGHWNAGESGGGKNSSRGGAFCHRNDVCTYYGEWDGADHPNGTSTQCNTDS